MGAEVFNLYDTTIGISKLLSNQENFNLTTAGDITVDNRGNKEVFPVIEIEVNTTTTLNSISNGSKIITFSISDLSAGDVLVLNFQEQIYKLNGNSIIDDINLNGLLAILQNEITVFAFDFTGDINITFTYDKYQQEEEVHYIQQFNVYEEKKYSTTKSFKSNKTKKRKEINTSYNFQLDKLSEDWINSDDEFRISFHIYNEDTFQEIKKYLIGVTFDNVGRMNFTNPNEIFKDNISGKAIDIIDKKY